MNTSSLFLTGLMMMALVGAGCGPSPSARETPLQAVPSEQEQAPSQDTSRGGEHIENPNARFGYLRTVAFGEIGMDTAEWLTGERAREQAMEDGECAPSLPCLPAGFFIRNRSTQIETLFMDGGVRVTLLDGPGKTRELLWEEFIALYATWPDIQKRITPFHAELVEGRVVMLREQSLDVQF